MDKMMIGVVMIATALILIALDDIEGEIKGLRRDLKRYNKKE